MTARHHVVVIGGGFGGLQAVAGLRRAPVEVTLVDRRNLLAAFESEGEPEAQAREAWLTFVIVGAGPTGVEIAGQIAALARDTLRHEFRTIGPRRARILLVEADDGVLTSVPTSLSAKAERPCGASA